MSTNHVTITGNLTRDPELKFTTKGTATCRLSIAHNEKSGETERVSFFEVQCWKHLAQAAATLKKGRPVMVTGKLREETWEDKQTGQKRSKVVIVAWDLSTITFAPREGEGDAPPPQARAPQPSQSAAPVVDGAEDDVPF